jgi:hypothetical protein
MVSPIPLLWCVVGGATLLAMQAPNAWLTLSGGLIPLLAWGWTVRRRRSDGHITPAERSE